MNARNLVIIGTSHIARESVLAVEGYIKKNKPEIVAIELDRRRAHALLHNIRKRHSLRMVRALGVKGFLFFIIAGFLQKRLGKLVGIDPGSEMRTALKAAIKEKLRIALIDRDIEITMKRLSQNLSWKERLWFVLDVLRGPFSGEMKEFRKMDLRKVPSEKWIVKVLKLVRMRYPNFYRVLVEERNEHMAVVLVDIMNKNPDSKILAVVGAGHEAELAALIREKLKKGTTYSFSFG
ncbi:TraB/GumN family protein [Candidatus Woesearchaeota archaeon]|nr:TraB/GumN family protein [Candidatus Woesearchaeota archaeon]